jgi:YVTN family beta-propeller protein
MHVSDDPRVGTELAGYRIDALLGRGGMGVVYLAEDLRLKRRVALKLVSPELAADEAFRERFLAESELAASIDHPNIVPIYEAGETDGGLLFIAMRYVEGDDLRARLRQGPLGPGETISLLAQVAAALDAAHARGLVHRDVKPSNVLIAPGAGHDGADHAYLADFGLTRRLSEQAVLAEDGQLMATIDYVAPEQIAGESIDGRADLYSLGCLLYECLTGEPPFVRESDLAVLFAHLEEPPPAPTEHGLELPGAIDGVIATALAKEPEERYSTCRELVGAARAGLGIAASERSRWLRAPVLLGLGGIALVAIGLASFLLVRGDGTPQPSTTSDSLVRIDPRTNEVTATIPVGENPVAIAVGPTGVADALTLTGGTAVWVANRDEATVTRIDPDTNDVELEAPTPGAPADIAASSRYVVVANGPLEAGIALLDAASGLEVGVFSLATGSFFGSPSVAAGTSGVWVATGDRRVGRLNVVSGALVDPVVIPQPADERADSVFSAIAVADDAIWVAGDPLDRAVWRFDPSTGELVATIRLPFAPKDLAVGDGAVWVTSQLDDTVSRIDPGTNEVTDTIPVGAGAAGIAAGAGAVWVANALEGTVSRIDPRTLRVETIDVDGYPDDIAVGADAVWVTTDG